MFKGALEGVKVIELSTMVAGPYCGKLLADMGADVIKIEPLSGDAARTCGPFRDRDSHPEKSALFLYNNTNKRGVTLELENERGIDLFKRMIVWADILIDNYPYGYLEKHNLDWNMMRQLNPGLIYVSITPYGRTGPRAKTKGDELTLTHAGGVGYLLPNRSTNIDRAPVKLGGYQVGYHGGLTAALATMGVLFGKLKSGEGRLIDISLQQVVLNLVGPFVAASRYHKLSYHRVPDRPPAMGRMEAKDGYVILAAWDDHHFKAFKKLMGEPEWLSGDQWDDMVWRMFHSMDIAPLIESWMKKQKKEKIYHQAAKMGIPIGIINSAQDIMNNHQYISRDFFVDVDHPIAGKYKYAGWPYKMSESDPKIRKPAPLLGQHNEEVYCDVLGYTREEFDRLHELKII